MRFRVPEVALAAGLIAAGALPASAQTAQQRTQMRFQAMDRNNDGRIQRSEWRGSDRSFEVHDWNRDGVLSGDEVRLGARQQARAWDDVDLDPSQDEYAYDDWTLRGFEALDHNRDNRITTDEWHFDRESFLRADHDRNGVLSRREFLNEDPLVDDDRTDRFRYLDANNDGRVSRAEWHGTAERFDVLDDNKDGVLNAAEMRGRNEPPTDLFSSVDINRDGSVTRQEWHWSRRSFDQRDANRDGRLSRTEFGAASPNTVASRSSTYRAGYERGVTEGRQAGKEDKSRNTWDLEGQRELEQADSGYHAGLGPRAEYQAGYREGFRRAYREGFGAQ
jgi:Ca2+-binding EF-hand superfamily protein